MNFAERFLAFIIFYTVHFQVVLCFAKGLQHERLNKDMVGPKLKGQLKGFKRRQLAQNDDEPSDLTVATYNLWNIMFHWEVRKFRIADMVRFFMYDCCV